MSSLRIGQKTNQGMLPQSPALESTSKDKPGVGTKRDVETVALSAVAGMQHGRGETGNGITCLSKRHSFSWENEDRSLLAPHITASRVFVLDRHGDPLIPYSPARARKLLEAKRARVHYIAPFVIRLIDTEAADSAICGVEIGIDSGSKTTGISVFRSSPDGRVGLVSIELQHQGQHIHKKLQQRSGYRRDRRTCNLRYCEPRFNNRTRSKGWLAPSLRHRVDSTMSILNKLRKWTPVIGIHQELVRFDTQKLINSDISKVEYQQGELAGYEVCEYLLAKFDRICAYCGAKDMPLNIDHIQARSHGGSYRVSNLVLACVPCNQSKGNLDLCVWLGSRLSFKKATEQTEKILARAGSPLKDAAAVNSTRWALYHALQVTELPVSVGTGGRMKWNRHRFHVVKSHSLDAICVGQVDGVVSYPSSVTVAKCSGQRTYARTISDKAGFPRITRPRIKCVLGFQTGDLVRAVVPSGKKVGTYIDRVAIRTQGHFNINTIQGTVQGIGAKYCTLSQRADGFNWLSKMEEGAHATK